MGSTPQSTGRCIEAGMPTRLSFKPIGKDFTLIEGNESLIQLEIPKKDAQGISFVFHNLNTNAWYNNDLKDYQIKFVH